MKMTLKDGKIMMIGDCSKELLDKLSKIVRLPPAIETYRQRLDETQRVMQLGLFEIKESCYVDSKGVNVVTRTIKQRKGGNRADCHCGQISG